MSLLKIAAVGAIAWIGYVIYKNKSVAAGTAQLEAELTSAKNTIAGLINSAKSSAGSSAPTSVPSATIAVTANIPQLTAAPSQSEAGNFTNFVGQPYWVANLMPDTRGMKQTFDASYGATMSPTPITIYE